MKKNEWNEGLDHIDQVVIEKYILQKDKLRQKKRSKRLVLRLSAVAACLALIVSTIIIVPMLREDDPGNIRPLHWADVSDFFNGQNNATSPNVTISPNEMYKKAFCEITSGKYATYKSGSIISDDCVGDKIDTAVVRTGWFQSWDKKEHNVYEVNAEVYEIDGIDRQVAVAIKYLEKPIADTTEDFYVYSNQFCEANSLSKFLEIYNADAYMYVLSNAYIQKYNENSSANYLYKINEGSLNEIKAIIINLTSTDCYSKYTNTNMQAIENITKNCKQRLQLTIDMKSAGRTGIIYFLDNGYMCFAGFGEFFALYSIGSDAAESIIDTVIDNAELKSSSTSDATRTEETTINSAD